MATINTKELIFNAFLEILETKPFDKITVRDIVEKCDLNRNTFYYHYPDIYALLEEIFSQEFNKITYKRNSTVRWIAGFSKMLEKAYSNPKVINNICASRSYEYLETFMFRSCRTILTEYIKDLAEGKNISTETIEFLILFYEQGVIGTLSDWFRTGMRETPQQMLKMFIIVFESIPRAIKSI